MSITAQNVVDDVRRQLHDEADGDYRWNDKVLFRFISECEREIKRRRPDLFFDDNDLMVEPVEITLLADILKLNKSSRDALKDLVCVKALSEETSDGGNLQMADVYRGRALEALGA